MSEMMSVCRRNVRKQDVRPGTDMDLVLHTMAMTMLFPARPTTTMIEQKTTNATLKGGRVL